MLKFYVLNLFQINAIFLVVDEANEVKENREQQKVKQIKEINEMIKRKLVRGKASEKKSEWFTNYIIRL